MTRFGIALSLVAIAAIFASPVSPPRVAAEVSPQPDARTPAQLMRLGLRGVYFVPNEGQWSDDSVIYGFRSRGLDVAFRESSLTMHLAAGGSRNEPRP